MAAVVAAFAFDTAVARMMVIPPGKPCDSLPTVLKGIFEPTPETKTVLARVTRGYRGMSARALEYFINYSVTGFTSVYVVMMFDAFLRREEGK